MITSVAGVVVVSYVIICISDITDGVVDDVDVADVDDVNVSCVMVDVGSVHICRVCVAVGVGTFWC